MTLEWVYLVIGSTGEYSDSSEWTVAAYVEEEAAVQHAALANEQMKPFVDGQCPGASYEDRDDFAAKFYLDNQCRIDYTGTKYNVVKVPLVLHVDQYQERFAK